MKIKHISNSGADVYQRFQKGDRQAFITIYDTYWKRLYTYAYRIYQDEYICEDIVQEIFISLWENRKKSNISNLEAYLLQSVKYKIANHIRDLKFTKVHEQVLENSIQTVDFSKKIEAEEFRSHINTLIELLPPTRRRIFLLSRETRLSNSEIAERLNISIRTVETQISNVLKFLRSNLNSLYYLLIILILFHR